MLIVGSGGGWHVKYHIEGNYLEKHGFAKQNVSYQQPMSPCMGPAGQNSTFSESGHVAYHVEGNEE